MKTRVLSIFLILLLCLTAGCGKAAQQNQTPDGISFSGSKTEESPPNDLCPCHSSFCKLEVDYLKLFGNGLEIVRLLLLYGFTEQRTYGCV